MSDTTERTPTTIDDALLDGLRLAPGEEVRLADVPTKGTLGGDFEDHPKAERKERAREVLEAIKDELYDAQELLWADGRYSVLVVFQAMDAAGKDSTIKHVMSGLNPQGCNVTAFQAPTHRELDHTFLWRCARAAPARGSIGIFNRSHYEEVLIARVHQRLLDAQHLPPGPRGKSFWQARFDDINAFEQHLDRNGTKVLKLFLHVSKEEQLQRFLGRLENPEKLWKFSTADVAERRHWDEYQRAYEKMLAATSTPWAPWYVVPADRKYAMRPLAAALVARTIRQLPLVYPIVSNEERTSLAAAHAELRAELEGGD